MNKRASYADIALVVGCLIVTTLLLANKDPDIRAVATIGEYQHELLDSYIVAENSRSYIEHSYSYAVQRALHTSGYCLDTNQRATFLTDLEIYLGQVYTQELPTEVHSLVISAPFSSSVFAGSVFYDVDEAITLAGPSDNEILTIDAEPIYVTNSNENFKINTSAIVVLSYNIQEGLCLQETEDGYKLIDLF
jgi:hypothetical protein